MARDVELEAADGITPPPATILPTVNNNMNGREEASADGADVQEQDLAHNGSSDPPSFPGEDEGLMDVYESRLRRLRDYETRVFSRYNNSPSDGDNEGGDDSGEPPQAIPARPWQSPSGLSRPTAASQLYAQFYEQENAGVSAPVLQYASPNPPGVIQVSDPHGEEAESFVDDLTLSSVGTPQNVGVETVSILTPEECEEDYTLEEAPETTEQDEVDSKTPMGHSHSSEDDYAHEEVANASNGRPWVKTTEYSTESEEDIENKEGSVKSDQEEDNGGPYCYLGGEDSKYETYAILVDPEQDDRAVEIALYTATRPHMRGFHVAWMAFFVAFFTWFAITPLLSEVAISLDLTREEIWTSSVLAVAGSTMTRIMIGPMNDIYGARWTMSATLLFIAIPTMIAGAVIHNATGLYVIRLLIGVAGSTFVTCQFWTSSMFTAEVAGTANSLAAGWGNLGGGVAQIVMGTLLFPLFKVIYGGEGSSSSRRGAFADDDEPAEYDRAADLAWRTVMAFPGFFCIIMAYVCIRYADDCPKGNFRKRKHRGLMATESALDALQRGASHWNTWLLFVQYGCCFGVEITMTNAAALYFKDEFGLSTESAAAIASIFGWMNLFARGIGGFLSDMTSATYGMRGRLWIQTATLIAEGTLVCIFSTTHTLGMAIFVMVIFSIFVQAAEGSTFGIVPYVNYSVTGSISGIVGAGGNVGGVIFSLLFLQHGDRKAFLWMGCLVLMSSILTAFISIPGHRSLLCGDDATEVLDRRDTHVGQLGSLPNVDLHAHNSEAHRNQSSHLRTPPQYFE
jgi:NNP family nitrate/nitrite transporter-like MFS transporter